MRSRYAKKVIENYYQNRDQIMLSRLEQIVSELFLSDTAAKRKRLWSRARAAMQKLPIPAERVEEIVARGDVQVLAKALREWIAASAGTQQSPRKSTKT